LVIWLNWSIGSQLVNPIDQINQINQINQMTN